MLDRLLKIKEMGRKFANGCEFSDFLLKNEDIKREINALYRHFFGQNVSGCSNCHFDAYLKLIHLDMETAKSKQECPFELRRGALLRDNDVAKNLTQANITEELARYHWENHPHYREFFTEFPDYLNETPPPAGPAAPNAEDGNETQVTEFSEQELEIIGKISEMLAIKKSKTDIKAELNALQIDGKKLLTGKRIEELIKAAEKLPALRADPAASDADGNENE